MKKYGAVEIACFVFAAIFFASGIFMVVNDFEWNGILPSNDYPLDVYDSEPIVSEYDGVATVIRVIDGDTFLLDFEGEEQRVRLIGVDTPESVAPANYSKANTSEGKEVSEIVKDKIREGDRLYYEYDVEKTDKYGRTLAYLYFDDETMIEDWLIENGYANVATYPPNVKYSEHFAELAHEAAENGVGLWNGFFTESEKR